MKTCKTCGLAKDISNYYKAIRTIDGLRGSCIDCEKVKMRQRYLANKDSYKKAAEKYRRSEKGKRVHKEANSRFRRTEKGKLSVTKSRNTFRSRFPEKHAAHITLNNAVAAGKIQKLPCSVCGSNSKVEAHHHDYSKPLDVDWLCQEHHKEKHHV